jgi:hypothetical protein
MINEATIGKLAEALSTAQATMSSAKKDKNNPFFKSKYADLTSIFEAIKEPFAENGLCVTQIMDVLESGRMVLKTVLMHKSGQSIVSSMILPDIADPQKLGSAITYFRRYSLISIAGIPAAEDDDGNSASAYVDSNKLKAKAKVQSIDDTPRVGITKGIELEKRLKEHTEYNMQIQDFLKKNKTTLSGLAKAFGERIEAKLNLLDNEAIEELREAHG